MKAEYILVNGCGEYSGYDYYEEYVRKDFEEHASMKGYGLERHPEWEFFYLNQRTENAWRMYHQGHVRGRSWGEMSKHKDEHTEFDKLLKELYEKYPEEMEEARIWVRQMLIDAAFDTTVEKYSDVIDELAKR